MSPRPRTVTDGSILAATARMITRLGPGRLTLADVGTEVGLSPATLVQRFGSKRGLLLALVARSVEDVAAQFAAARVEYRSPLEAVLAVAAEFVAHARTPEELANNLAFFQIDLSDPDFHRLALEHSRRVRNGYRTLLDDATAADELVSCDTGALASALQAVASGSLLNWAVHRDGAVAAWVRADIETLIAPYRRAPAPRRPVPSPASGATGAARRR